MGCYRMVSEPTPGGLDRALEPVQNGSIPLPRPWSFGVHINAVRVRALAINKIVEIRVVKVIAVLIDQSRSRTVGGGAVDSSVALNFERDFKGSLLVRALECIFLAGAEFIDDVMVLLLQAAQFIDELILIEIQLEFAPDLVIECRCVVELQ
ncbi:hypothetical protein C2S53_010418 [Perilla frutescens var. hirtella]|uniref:Uncharacterized protein n=1 Tax=Perilla frutescens var. hirtella TaxID=608512 RepID=A0AAD4P994_PERFH|nr:hypothetical protein C2S53_010418 [Perilla frutescens var. hirtella]